MIGAETPSNDRVPPASGALAVLRNRSFLLLWLSQAATQIGGNMVLYGLTVIVLESTQSNAAVSGLILTFLVPAVLLSAVAGVYVDRFDARLVLWVTNLLRGLAIFAMVFASGQLGLIYLLNIFVSTVTTFFSPAEATMIPRIVPRGQLVAANGIFTITLNAAFALGFALFGSLAVSLAGPTGLLVTVAALYLVASAFCFTLPRSPVRPGGMRPGQVVTDAERAVSSTFGQLREGLAYIRANPSIAWSIVYLGATASLVGVLGVLGPGFATRTLGLAAKDFIVIVLPLGFGVVVGILVLNNLRARVARRRLIETGLVVLGGLIATLAVVGQLTRSVDAAAAATSLGPSSVVSVLSMVIAVAFLAGIAYAAVAISAQTQLQEELPEDIRGRVYGVLFSLISVASFIPVIVVGPIADLVGTTTVLLGVAASVGAVGLVSIVTRRAPREAAHLGPPAPVEPLVLTPHSPVPHSEPAGRDGGARGRSDVRRGG
ncbi:MAG: MFS transporter [Candidatus Limnocylindrales bacterium]